MNMLRSLAISALLAALPAPAQDPAPSTFDELAPHATGIWLVEVTKLAAYDARPSDGDAGLSVILRGIRGSGQFHPEIDVITAFGGARAPGDVPALPTFIRPDTFKAGLRYWIAFASAHEFAKHSQGVVAFWPEGDRKVEQAMDDAVRKDVCQWSPRFDPKTALTYGRRNDDAADGLNKQWRIRVEKNRKVLWEKVVPGTMSSRSFSWTLDESAAANFPGIVPPCGKMLVAETATRLEAGNEYGLPAGMVYLRTACNPETGLRLQDRITTHQDGDVHLLTREYDAETGKVRKEIRK